MSEEVTFRDLLDMNLSVHQLKRYVESSMTREQVALLREQALDYLDFLKSQQNKHRQLHLELVIDNTKVKGGE